MSPPPASTPEPETMEHSSVRGHWDAAVGKVFKLTNRNPAVRTVTYTRVNAVRDAEPAGTYDIELLCVEITGRTLSSKRAYSNILKEGVLRQDETDELLPSSFGTACLLSEFEKVTTAILAYTNSYLDWVMQSDPEERTDIDMPIDLPHLKLDDMEASLVRNSPFLVRDTYFLTPNSIAAAQASIRQELKRALRGMLLTDAVDEAYVTQKNEAIATLQAKLKEASIESEQGRAIRQLRESGDPHGANGASPREADSPGEPPAGVGALLKDSLALALLGKLSATTVRWVRANPSEEGPVYCLGAECSPLEFVRWIHVSGSAVAEPAAAGRKLRDYFKGIGQGYTGPDRDGIYPLLKRAAD